MSTCAIDRVSELDDRGGYRVCFGCLARLDDQLGELAERWPLVAAAVEPSTQPTERVSGSRDYPMPGGEAMNLIGPGNLSTREELRPAWRTMAIVPFVIKRDQPSMCGSRHDRSICRENLGHIHRHRDLETGQSWPHQQRVFERRAVRDEFGQVALVRVGDQHGAVNPIEYLWSWSRDWLARRRAGEVGASPELAALARWLKDRLDWAGQSHPAVELFAEELWEMIRTVRSVLNVTRFVQRYREPCPRCDEVALYREVDPRRGASAWVQCGSCGNLWRESEFSRLGLILEGEARAKVHAG